MVGLLVAILAGTVVANALPRITAELRASQSSYTWVIIPELLSMTATVPLWGKLSDLYSKTLLLQTSLGLFVVGSLVIRGQRLRAAAPDGASPFGLAGGWGRGALATTVT